MPLFTLIFSILISVVCFWMSCKMIKIYFKVKKWDRVPATVTSKKIELHVKTSAAKSPYGIFANYKYLYKENTYLSNKVYLVELVNGQVNYMESNAKIKLNEIKDDMYVFVNPHKPNESVIFCSGIGLYSLIFCFGFIALLLGISQF